MRTRDFRDRDRNNINARTKLKVHKKAVNENEGVSPHPASVVVIAREGATTEVKGAGVDVPEARGESNLLPERA